MLEKVRAFLQTYPGLEDLRVDCLPGAAGGFSLNSVPIEPVLRRYLDGTEKRQCRMNLWGRRSFGEDTASQEENLRWFADFAAWLAEQERVGNRPDLGETAKSLSLLPVDTAAPESIGNDGLCCYQMTLQLIYLQES